MKKLTIILALVVLTVVSQSVFAQVNTATQTVTLQVAAVNRISISGPVSLLINDAPADLSGLSAVSNNASSFNLVYNGTAGKVTAAINTAVPAGTTLEVTLSGGSKVDVGAGTAVDALTGLSKTKLSAQSITYDFSATPAAGVIASVDKTITFTVTE